LIVDLTKRLTLDNQNQIKLPILEGN
jgi:hypothetical protein